MQSTPSDDAVVPARPSYIPSNAGEELAVGVVIEEVVQVSYQCGVYITQGNKLHWVYELGACVDAERSISSAVELLTQLNSLPISATTRRRGLKIIGTALHEAFMDRTANDRRDYFKSAKEYVTLRHREATQMNYFAVAMATFCSAVGALLFVLNFDAVRPFAIGAIMGGVGAFVSVAQRFRSIPIDRYSSFTYIALGGISRILFGIIFGALFRLMHEAGLVLSSASGNLSMLAVASFVAGFSERLIPDLLQQVERGFRGSRRGSRSIRNKGRNIRFRIPPADR